MAEEKEKVGYVKVFRKIEDWKYFNNPYVLQVFLFCLLNAEKDYTRDKRRDIDEGTFTITIVDMARILKRGRPKVYECLNILKNDKVITLEKDGKNTIIRVLNYSKYQDNFGEKIFEKSE
jgi:hypothetical protein